MNAAVTRASPSSYERRFADLIGPDVEALAFWKGRVALYAILRALASGRATRSSCPA